jgi:hypothetical protein
VVVAIKRPSGLKASSSTSLEWCSRAPSVA